MPTPIALIQFSNHVRQSNDVFIKINDKICFSSKEIFQSAWMKRSKMDKEEKSEGGINLQMHAQSKRIPWRDFFLLVGFLWILLCLHFVFCIFNVYSHCAKKKIMKKTEYPVQHKTIKFIELKTGRCVLKGPIEKNGRTRHTHREISFDIFFFLNVL